MTGKKYLYAAIQIANNHLFSSFAEEGAEFDPQVIEFVFSQLTIKATTKIWGNDTIEVAEKEMKQLHWQKSIEPVHWTDL